MEIRNVAELENYLSFPTEADVAAMAALEGDLLILGVGGKMGPSLARLARRANDLAATRRRIVAVARFSNPDLPTELSSLGIKTIACDLLEPGALARLPEIANVIAQHGKRLIIDAMSSFGALPVDAQQVPFDALIAASGKCLEGVPGMGFVFARKESLANAAGNSHSLAMDLFDQHTYMAKTGQWRFTPPTHVVAALHEALLQYNEEGGLPARHQRYADNCNVLLEDMARLGLRSFLPAAIQAPIIVTFHAPKDPRYQFKEFYERVKAKGFILYPGKLTQVETFRVGCIGHVNQAEMHAAVAAVAEVLREMEVLEI